MRIHFVDLNERFIREIGDLLGRVPGMSFTCGDVRDLARDCTAFVSPSNSLLFMDGGIDAVYGRSMFPGVERKLRAKVSALGLKTKLGRPYLPVGSAIAELVEDGCVIASPTMFLPHDVSATRNAYHSFMAALLMFEKVGAWHSHLTVLACPALCTGYGCMDPAESARQMRDAWEDFAIGRRPCQASHAEVPWCYVTDTKDEEQPVNYDNREIKDIAVVDLIAATKRA